MKTRLLRLLGSSLLLSGCLQNPPPSAHNHHTRIVNLITQADDTYQSYNLTTQNQSINDIHIIQQQHQKAIKKIEIIQKNIKNLEPYGDNDTYLTTAQTYIQNTHTILTEHDAALIQLRQEVLAYEDSQRTLDIEKQHQKRQQTTLNTINTIIQQDHQALEQAQKTFAEQHDLTLTGTAQNPS